MITCDAPDESCGRCHGVTLFGGAELSDECIPSSARRVILPRYASQLSDGGVLVSHVNRWRCGTERAHDAGEAVGWARARAMRSTPGGIWGVTGRRRSSVWTRWPGCSPGTSS